MAKEYDAISLEVVRNKLEGIANEMQSTLLRASFSPIVREGLDASSSLFTVSGETLAQGISIPIHLGTMIPMMARILKTFSLEDMKEGDIYLMNDPYLGGTHLPDIMLTMPVFSNGVPVAFAATITHHQDIGGMAPGSIPTNATEVYQEGLRLPPLKYRDGADGYNQTLRDILRLNSRIPDTFIGDIEAQVSACSVGAKRLQELAEPFGSVDIKNMFEILLDRSEKMTREELLKIKDGTYEYSAYNDNDGIELDKKILIKVAVTINKGTFHCDFTGTSNQVKGPFNVVPSGSLAAACFALNTIISDDVPINGGCFRAVSLTLPEGSILNPREPAAVNSRTATIKRVANSILSAMRTVIPNVVGAEASGEMLAVMFGGDDGTGRRYVVGELIAGGSGAGPESDGVDVVETDATNCMNLPVEAIERDAPIRVHSTHLAVDSGGAGRQRGGLGIHREYELLAGECTFTYRGERHYHSASGAFGGLDGGKASAYILRNDGKKEVIPSKIVTTLLPGDRVIIETAGGGGFGSPCERKKESVRHDILNGKISETEAKKYTYS